MSTLSKPFGNFFLSLQRDSRESSVTGTTLKTAKMKEKYSTTFLLMAVTFIVCLIVSNLFATKVFSRLGHKPPRSGDRFPDFLHHKRLSD